MNLPQRIHSYRTILDALAEAPADAPFVTMYEPGGNPDLETLNFGQFAKLAAEFAGLFQEHGVKSRDSVILLMPQGIPLMAAFTGALQAGAIPTILAYPTFKIDPEKYQYGLSGVTKNIHARLILLDQDFPAQLSAFISRDEGTHVAHWPGGSPGGAAESSPGRKPWEKSANDEKAPEGRKTANPDDIAFLQHSAGTTGLQKGVALPHRAVLNQIRYLAEALHLTKQDRIVSWLPLYHDMGLIACFMLPLICHLHVVMQSPTDWILRPVTFLQLASRYRCTLAWLPNFAFQFLARRVLAEDRRDLDLSSFRAIVSTSEPVRAQSMNEFYEAYRKCGLSKTALQTSYGMAESTFAVTQSVVDGVSTPRSIWIDRELLQGEARVKLVPAGDPQAVSLVSCGRCLGSNAVRVVDERSGDLPPGGLGQIVVRTDYQFDGYFNRPDLTARVLRDGWYWTGDFGFVLDDELYVIGRKNDMIIVGGRNLYPQDVEEIAFSHPRIHDGRAIALGLFNPDLGTEDLIVIAEVSCGEDLKEGRQIAAEIRESILAAIGVAPRIVHIVPPRWIIKSTAGKPARSTNREKFLRENPDLSCPETGVF